jgi:outer membrane protein assembly factor BamB
VAYLDETGQVTWTRNLPDGIHALVITGNGTSVIIGGMSTGPDSGGNISRISSNGTMQWNYRTAAPIVSLAASEDGAYLAAGASGYYLPAGSQDADLFFLDDTGHVLWSARTGRGNKVAMDPYARSVAVATSGKNLVSLYDRQGIRLFSVPVRAHITAIAISPDGEKVYAGIGSSIPYREDEPVEVICLDRKGSVAWKYPVNHSRTNEVLTRIVAARSAPVIATSTSTGNVTILSSEGTMIQEFSTGEPVEGIALSDDATRVIVRTRQHLFQFSPKSGPHLNQSPVWGVDNSIAAEPDQDIATVTKPEGNPAGGARPSAKSPLTGLSCIIALTGIILFIVIRKRGA